MPPPVISAFHQSKDSKAASGSLLGGAGTWDVGLEYDPFWPNEYDKVVRDRAARKERERAEAKEKERSQNAIVSTLTSRPLVGDYSDDEDDDKPVFSRPTGAAIAPPPSIIETVVSAETASAVARSAGVSVVAAKIMARMGYNQGQGLGKDEQGMSHALEVEKTSKHGGKIVASSSAAGAASPPAFAAPMAPPPPAAAKSDQSISDSNESITEMMKNPSKVILLRNMVGPGEVDDDLEPETKEECSKYGDVASCVIFEMPQLPAEEAVRIFVEFKRVESAIKAVVDLNGRFFGGRTVKAGFFDFKRFKNLDLKD